MEVIRVQSLICFGGDLGKGRRDFIAPTTYDLIGQDSTPEGARVSAVSVTVNLLDVYARAKRDLPKPSKQLESLEEVAEYFSPYLSKGAKVARDETITREEEEGLSQLIFDFYRVEN